MWSVVLFFSFPLIDHFSKKPGKNWELNIDLGVKHRHHIGHEIADKTITVFYLLTYYSFNLSILMLNLDYNLPQLTQHASFYKLLWILELG